LENHFFILILIFHGDKWIIYIWTQNPWCAKISFLSFFEIQISNTPNPKPMVPKPSVCQKFHFLWNLNLKYPKTFIAKTLGAKIPFPSSPLCAAKISVHDFRLLHLPNILNHCVCEVVVVRAVCGCQRVLRSFEGGTLFFLFIIFDFSSLKMFLITDFTLKSC